MKITSKMLTAAFVGRRECESCHQVDECWCIACTAKSVLKEDCLGLGARMCRQCLDMNLPGYIVASALQR